jgi:non-heme Fe2+,alpha-ketoglutarate-dependent halogenase
MPKMLTQKQIERYHRDGFLYPLPAFSREEAARYRARLEAFEARQGQKLGKGSNFKPHLLFPWVDEIVRHPAVLDAVEDLIGPDIRLFHLTVWPKSAHDPAFVGWHQDATYFGLEPAIHVTAWVALTDASVEAGCMEVIPGSHRNGQFHHHETPSADNMLSRGQTLSVDFDRSRAQFMPVKAGEFSLHDTHLIHASGPNRSNDRRIGLGISYVPTHVRCTSATRVTAALVRGVDRYGHFDDEPRPQEEYGAAEREFHAEAVRRFREANREQTAQYAETPPAA